MSIAIGSRVKGVRDGRFDNLAEEFGRERGEHRFRGMTGDERERLIRTDERGAQGLLRDRESFVSFQNRGRA